MPIYQGKTASCLTPNTVSKKPVAHLSSPNVNLWITKNQAFRFCGGLFSFFGTEVSSRAQKTHFVNFTLNRRGGYYPPVTSLRGGWGWVAERVAYALRRFLRRGQGPLGAKVASLAVRVAILPRLHRTLFASSRQTPLFRCFALRNAGSRFVAAPLPQKSCDFRGPLLTTGRAHRLRPPYRRGSAARQSEIRIQSESLFRKRRAEAPPETAATPVKRKGVPPGNAF